ncbi:hypothetical protein K2173_000131 [Erythroxylum novogranatense]|uniref:Josephin-like protein n=1 Tax=Erythroxylum novogranatense TaxID=1862640 RepID=A0AAV8SNJ9_9ROSI|nr:hypothetical protein K2173_000131 [Erythroxylum novogranatense]
MSRRASKRVSFSPEVNDNKTSIFLKHGVGSILGGNKRRVAGIFSFRLPKSSSRSRLSPARVLRHLGAKVVRVLRFASTKRKTSSGKVSSSAILARSRSLADTFDSQRAEAIEDCIEFLNSSSSLSRSNSVSAY